MHAARCERDLFAVAEIEMPVPDMHIAVAHPGRLDPQDHFGPLRLRIGVVARLQLLAPLDDLHRTHILPSWIISPETAAASPVVPSPACGGGSGWGHRRG